MNSDSDQLLNRLVVAALTLFCIVSLLLAAFVFREIWLQQRIVGLSSDLQVNIEDLAQTTEEIQSEMSGGRTTRADAEGAKDWDSVTVLLENVDQQLELIGENIDEVATVRESEGIIGNSATSDNTADDGAATDSSMTDSAANGDAANNDVMVNSEASDAGRIVGAQAGQVFTIFTVLISLAAITIAVLLGKAMRVQEHASLDENKSP